MVIDFKNLPDESRVWVYQSNRAFTNEEMLLIEAQLKSFVASWTHHGDALNAASLIKFNQFIVLGIDEKTTGASGCSIDASIFFIKQIETQFKVQLLDRMQTAFILEEEIQVVNLAEFTALVKLNTINEETLVFNNLVATKSEFDNLWKVPAKKSWHKRYFI